MSTQELVHQPKDLTVTNEQMSIARNTVAKGLNNDQFAVYLYNCQRQGVHPLDGLIVPIVRKESDGSERLTFVTTVDLLRSRAADTGDYAGSDDPIFSEYNDKTPWVATVTVWKFVQREKCSFTATARYDEYFPGEKQGFMWRSKPHVMLGKCAEGLALRKAFPKQLAGLYLEEELAKDNKPQTRKPPEKPVGSVKCTECGATNGHLPSCKHQAQPKPAEAAKEKTICADCGKLGGHEPSCKYAAKGGQETMKPTTKHALMILDVTDKRTAKGVDYVLVSTVAPDNSEGKLFVWHKSFREHLLTGKGKTMLCEVSSDTKDGKTFYQLEHILEIGGVAFVNDAPAQQGEMAEEKDPF